MMAAASTSPKRYRRPKRKQPNNNADNGNDANSRVVTIDIRDVNSGELECTFRLPCSHKLERIYDALRGWRGGEDSSSFILKYSDGSRVASLEDTPNSLGMSDSVELFCVPSIKVDIRNFWTREIECSFDMGSKDTFRLIHPFCVKMRGSAAFDFSFNGRRVKLNETPSSLGMKNRVELICVPVPWVEIVIKDEERPGTEQRFIVRRCQQLRVVYRKYREIREGVRFFFMWNGRKLSLHETPDSLRMNDQVEISCVSSSSVIVDIFNVETQQVEWTKTLASSASFKDIFMACEDNRLHYKDKSRFSLEFNGTRINYDDTPHSLGMVDRVEISYKPNPDVEIGLHNKYGEYVCTFRLKPHQPLRTIYNAYSKLSFHLVFKGIKVPPEATPNSLGMMDYEDLAWEQTVSIVIHNIESDKLEHAYSDFSKVTRIEDYTQAQRKDKAPFFLKTTYGKIIRDIDTPDTLYMNGNVKLFFVPAVLISIRNSETQEVVQFHLRRSSTFQDLYNDYLEGGDKCFDFIFRGVVVDLGETPISLGLKNYAEFVYVPHLVNILIRNRMTGEVEHRYHGTRTVNFRSIKEETIEKRSGNSAFTFSLDGVAICGCATPNSLKLGDSVEIQIEPFAVIDIRDSVTQDVVPFELGRAITFRTLFDTYKEFEGSNGDDDGSFDFYFNGVIIDLGKDTPESLGMKDREEVVCVPQFTDEAPKKECSCVNCRKKLSEDEEMPSTIDIVFFDKSSSDEVVLRTAYDGKMKTLLSRYASTRGLPLKSLRFKYDDRILFVSSIGNKSPYNLGMQNNDIVYASRLGNIDANSNNAEETSKKSCSSQGTGAKKGKAKSKKKALNQPSYSTMDEGERLRRAHSKMLTRVFDEANSQFKEIRQQLNNLALEQTPAKPKSLSPRVRATEPTPDISDIFSFSLENKAIKTRFNIIAGEVSNLYKSSKPSKKIKSQEESITIDLHGYTKAGALEKLDASLPSWVDAAMHGEYPFVIPVTIVCGAGGQVLSEVVEQWIRENERVAKARKNMFI